MLLLTDKETKHIKDRNFDTQGHSEHEIAKIKTEYIYFMWVNNKVNKKLH